MYRPPREILEVRVYTREHRIYGLIHQPPLAGITAYLNQDRPFLSITGALLYSPGVHHPPRLEELVGELAFLAVRKHRILYLVGGKPDEAKGPGEYVGRRLLFLFSSMLLLGELLVPKGVRLSDFISQIYQTRPFQLLRRAGVYPLVPGKPVQDLQPLEEFEFLTLNLQQVEGVAEVAEGVEETRLTLF
ncbi:MAG: DUF6812 domain-containing protein [Thermaceae bacterium]